MTATCVGLGNDLFPLPGAAGKPVPGWDGKCVCVPGFFLILHIGNLQVMLCL